MALDEVDEPQVPKSGLGEMTVEEQRRRGEVDWK